MDIHDREQTDQFKHWWSRNGLSVCVGLGIGVSAVLGWRLWEARVQERTVAAAEIYADMREAVANSGEEEPGAEEDPRREEELLQVLQEEYSRTPYAALGALQLARLEVEAGRLATARGHLEWAVEHASDTALRHVARMRLARVLLALRDLDEAERHLRESAALAGESAMYQELWGDLQELREQPGMAIEAYREAYRLASDRNADYLPILRLKLEVLGVDPEELEQLEEAVEEERG